MIITKLELENITTHRRTTIQFAKGVNILAGKNGTGKSSVLRMIGLSLFDCYAKDSSRFKRDIKQESGEAVVKIYFQKSDTECYRIIRTIGKIKGFEIQQQLGTKFKNIPGIKSKEDYKNWLKETMNLNSEYNLETLFNNAVGVEQGTFTAPFLESPSVRMAIFAPIINVDIYDKLFKNYLPIIHEFETEFNQIDKKKATLDGEISFKEQFLKENQESNDELNSVTQQHQTIEKELRQITEEYEKLYSIKSVIDSLNNTLERLKGEVSTNQAKLTGLQQNIEKSQTSKEICNKLKSIYDSYGQYYDSHRNLQKQNQNLQALKSQETDLKQKLARIQGLTEKINQDIANIEALKPEYLKLQKYYDESQIIQKDWDDNQKKLSRVNTIQTELQKKQQKYQDNQKRITLLNSELEKHGEFQTQVEKLDQIQAELTSIEKQIAAIESEIKQYSENKSKSKDGMCPFLHEQCKNIQEESLESYFEVLITDRTKGLRDLQTKLKKMKVTFHNTRELEVELKRLDKLIVQKEEFVQQSSILNREIDEAEKDISIKQSIENTLQKLTQKREEYDPYIKNYHAYQEKIQKDLPELLDRQKVMKENLHDISLKIDPIHKKIEDLKEIPQQLDQISKKLDDIKPQYEEYQSNIKLANQLEDLKRQYEDIRIKAQKTTEIFNQENEKLTQLNKSFNLDRLNLITTQKQNLNRQESALETKKISLKQQIDNLKTKLDKIKEKEKELEHLKGEYERLMRIYGFSTQIRNWFKDAGPLITEAIMKQINSIASIVFREMINQEAVELIWEKDYELKVKTPLNTKTFNQLSGGEQMAAALSIRLAILQIMANVGFAFFDEPTTNLDPEKRSNLSQSLKNIKGFEQLFVISHDDTFESMGDYIIRFEKDENEETRISYSI